MVQTSTALWGADSTTTKDFETQLGELRQRKAKAKPLGLQVRELEFKQRKKGWAV